MPSLWHNRRLDYMNYAIAEAPPPPETQNLASVESWILKLEQLASTLPLTQPVVASLQGVSKFGVQPQYTNSNNPDIQRLNQRH